MPFLLLKKSNLGFLGGKWEAYHFLFPEIQNMQIRRGSRLSEWEFPPGSVPLLQMEKMQRSLPPGGLVFSSMLSRNVECPNSIGQGEKQKQREGVELCLEWIGMRKWGLTAFSTSHPPPLLYPNSLTVRSKLFLDNIWEMIERCG